MCAAWCYLDELYIKPLDMYVQMYVDDHDDMNIFSMKVNLNVLQKMLVCLFHFKEFGTYMF